MCQELKRPTSFDFSEQIKLLIKVKVSEDGCFCSVRELKTHKTTTTRSDVTDLGCAAIVAVDPMLHLNDFLQWCSGRVYYKEERRKLSCIFRWLFG